MYRVRSPGAAPLADNVANSIASMLKELYDAEFMDASLTAVVAALPGRRDERTFVIGDRRSLAPIAAASQGRFEIINARSGAVPFYLFARVPTIDLLRRPSGAPVKVAYGVSDSTRAFDTTAARELFTGLFGAAPSSIVPTSNHRELVQRLVSTDESFRVDVVGIYDEEPSVLLHDFLDAYRSVRPADVNTRGVKLYFFPTREDAYAPGARVTGNRGSTYSFVPFEDLLFYDLNDVMPPMDANDGLVAIASPSFPATDAPDAPVLLSNVRRIAGAAGANEVAKARQVVSYAYLAALLIDQTASRCSGKAVPVFQSYLLKAAMADAASIPKGLSLWSNQKLAPEAAPTPSQEMVVRMIKEKLKGLKLPQTDAATSIDSIKLDYGTLAARLASASPRPSVRRQFSGDEATIFSGAAAQIKAAVVDPAHVTAGDLDAARSALIELLRRSVGPGCNLSGLGLFGAKGYDPFFYLGLIDSLLTVKSPN